MKRRIALKLPLASLLVPFGGLFAKLVHAEPERSLYDIERSRYPREADPTSLPGPHIPGYLFAIPRERKVVFLHETGMEPIPHWHNGRMIMCFPRSGYARYEVRFPGIPGGWCDFGNVTEDQGSNNFVRPAPGGGLENANRDLSTALAWLTKEDWLACSDEAQVPPSRYSGALEFPSSPRPWTLAGDVVTWAELHHITETGRFA